MGNLVVLRGGYGGELNQLLSGSILKSVTTREGTDFITELEIGDGSFALASAHVSQVFPQGTSELNILEAAIEQLQAEGISVSDDYDKSDFNNKLQRSVSVSSPAKDVLIEYATKNGYSWSIQDSQLQLLKITKGKSEPAFLLTPATGLIGSPKQNFNAVSFNTLIIADLTVGAKVLIQTSTIDAAFVVLKINLRGDTHGNEWSASCEGLVL